MILKGLAISALLLAMTAAAQSAAGKAPANPSPAAPAASSASPPQSIAIPLPRTDCEGGTCDYQPPHITVANPPVYKAIWPLQDRIAWVANLLLVVFGYAGIMIALSLLRKIERQTRYLEVAADAAAGSAKAALHHVEAMVRSERPWILITVEPSRSVENGFTVIAGNRGSTPAMIVAAAEQVRIAADEEHLPAVPEYSQESDALTQPIYLLPGEFKSLKRFSRDDVKGICETEELLKKVDDWNEKIYLYGKVTYVSLIGPDSEQAHETGWCCWYIHGRQKSGMVMAGPPAYNMHT